MSTRVKLNLDGVIKGLGNDLPFIDSAGQILTIRKVIVEHLGMLPVTTGEEAVRAIDLGLKIMKNLETDFSEDDIKFIRMAVVRKPLFPAMVIASVIEALENPTSK